LSFAVNIEQQTTHEPYRLRRTEDGELDLQALMAGQWSTLYRFTLHPQLPVDYEPANWFVSTHPDSFFVNNVIAVMPGEGCRYTLFNREFRTRWPDGRVETVILEDKQALSDKLQERFGIAVSPDDAQALSASFR
jgi:N-hydroxyarylamine O-acetyltransferase